MYQLEHISVADSSSIGEARRFAVRVAEGFHYDESLRGKIAIVASELASNLVKHGGPKGGEILISSRQIGSYSELGILAYDRGPGMSNVNQCMQDGFSTSGTVGGGLGAISRLPNVFDIYSRPTQGTAIYCSFEQGIKPEPGPLDINGLNIPYPGETVSGDGYSWFNSSEFSVVMVADGLGHGPEAHEASQRAIETFHTRIELAPAAILESIHTALIRTRGAAVAIARIDHAKNELNYSGLGNISGQILQREGSQSLLTLDGIVGQIARRFHSVTYPWSTQSTLIMHSDGLSSRSRFDAETYPGLQARHPQLIAAVLMRDAKRGRDDSTVVVAKPRVAWSPI